MYVTRTSLFPDIAGYAKYMAMKYENLNNFSELIDLKLREEKFLIKQGVIKKEPDADKN